MPARAGSEDLPVFVRWMEVVGWLLPATGKFPERVRFTLSDRIGNLVLGVSPSHLPGTGQRALSSRSMVAPRRRSGIFRQ